MAEPKLFDCVEMKNAIQAKPALEFAGMTVREEASGEQLDEAAVAHVHEAPATVALAPLMDLPQAESFPEEGDRLVEVGDRDGYLMEARAMDALLRRLLVLSRAARAQVAGDGRTETIEGEVALGGSAIICPAAEGQVPCRRLCRSGMVKNHTGAPGSCDQRSP